MSLYASHHKRAIIKFKIEYYRELEINIKKTVQHQTDHYIVIEIKLG